jgi:hypothetical protein
VIGENLNRTWLAALPTVLATRRDASVHEQGKLLTAGRLAQVLQGLDEPLMVQVEAARQL